MNADIRSIENLRKFGHDAMSATFEAFIIHADGLYAEQAAQAAFEALDRIESNLSRFIENSDVSRINSIGKGRPLQIGLSTFECLQSGVEMFRQTNGAFDIAFGSLHRGSNLLKLNEAEHIIELRADGVKIDLGAIGKGYAADKMRQVLVEWGITTAFISAGQSTVLAIGKPPGLLGWPITISNPADNRVLAKIHLADIALSASGLQKGKHIINPRSGRPANGKSAGWATAKTAAEADALSTAFMVMPLDEVRSFCAANADTSAIIIPKDKERNLLRFGRWDNAEFYR
ncbi:MAG: FAD:protein FMN transferase [Sedimentisphaerales bacterium]|nr:FAD:protein FMN transferase [Sedimentisphaerales bacterium]